MPDNQALQLTENSIYHKSVSATNHWKSIEGNTGANTASGSGGGMNSNRGQRPVAGVSVSGQE